MMRVQTASEKLKIPTNGDSKEPRSLTKLNGDGRAQSDDSDSPGRQNMKDS